MFLHCEFLCNPAKWPYRYYILFLLCYIHGSLIFCIENIGGLSSTIIQVMNIDAKSYETLFSFFTWPGILICFVGGLLFDKVLGIKLGFIIVIILAIIGEALISIGACVNEFSVMLLGRFVLGIGTELQLVVMYTYLSLWFVGKDSNFAWSLNLSAGRIAGSVALLIMQYVYEWSASLTSNSNYCLGVALLTGVLVMCGSLVAGALIILFDNKAAAIGRNKDLHNTGKPTKNSYCKNLKQLMSLDYLLVAIATAIYIPIVFAFTGIGQHYFMQKYGFRIHKASFANSVVFLGVVVLNPLLGAMVSVTGYKISWAQLGILLGLLSHLLYALSNISDQYVVFISGLIYSQSYSLFTIAMLTVPGQLVHKDLLSTAYGLFKSMVNLNYAVICLITGVIVDYAGFAALEVFYLFLLYIVFLLLCLLLASNRRINMSQSKCSRVMGKQVKVDSDVIALNESSIMCNSTAALSNSTEL